MTSADLLYGVLPPVLIGVGVVGFLYRFFTGGIPTDGRPAVAATRWATLPTRWGLGIVLGFHAIVLLFPDWVVGWDSSPARLHLLEGTIVAVSLGALFGVFAHLVHFANDARRPRVTPADVLVVGAMLLFLVTGVLASLVDTWVTSWTAGAAAPALRSILGPHPRPDLIGTLPTLAVAHLLTFFIGMAALPFSRFAMWAAVPVRAVHGFVSSLIRPSGEFGWGGAWARAGIVLGYFVVFTVIIPSRVVDSLGSVPHLVRDAVVGGIWAGFLVGGLWMLRWAQRTQRI
jgi:hypothetical protein